MEERPPSPKRTWVNGVLFVMTAFSIFFVGLSWSLSYVHADALAAGAEILPALDVVLQPRILGLSFVYAAALLVILLGHEFGHYLMCRHYGLEATLPYFIPAPTLIGTLGAFIRIKSRITSKLSLFDIGSAGPFASFALSLPALGIGLALSKVVPALPREGTIVFGEPLLFKLVGNLTLGSVPAGADIVLHPLAFAGWVGILVTSFNLLPVGQLDGGHIAYAVLGKKTRGLSGTFTVIFLAMALFFWVGWAVWAVILRFIGLKHPALEDEDTPLTPGRRKLAVLAVAVFVLSFIPDPVRGFDGLTVIGDWIPSLRPALEGLRFF
jgi:Zn-dependent protease